MTCTCILAEFQKCPLSIPNGSLEPHCGPATDWLCHFECNDGYAKHAYMKGTLKWFADREYSLLCEEGMWKTGYEYVGLDVSGVCVPSGMYRKLLYVMSVTLVLNLYYCIKSSAHVINSHALIGEKPCINKSRAVNARLRNFQYACTGATELLPSRDV